MSGGFPRKWINAVRPDVDPPDRLQLTPSLAGIAGGDEGPENLWQPFFDRPFVRAFLGSQRNVEWMPGPVGEMMARFMRQRQGESGDTDALISGKSTVNSHCLSVRPKKSLRIRTTRFPQHLVAHLRKRVSEPAAQCLGPAPRPSGVFQPNIPGRGGVLEYCQLKPRMCGFAAA
jgi:hypothetical protein